MRVGVRITYIFELHLWNTNNRTGNWPKTPTTYALCLHRVYRIRVTLVSRLVWAAVPVSWYNLVLTLVADWLYHISLSINCTPATSPIPHSFPSISTFTLLRPFSLCNTRYTYVNRIVGRCTNHAPIWHIQRGFMPLSYRLHFRHQYVNDIPCVK